MKILSTFFTQETKSKDTAIVAEANSLIKDLRQANSSIVNMYYYIVTYALNLEDFLYTIAEITFYNFFTYKKFDVKSVKDFTNIDNLEKIKKDIYKYIYEVSSTLSDEQKLKEAESKNFTKDRLTLLLAFLLCLSTFREDDFKRLKFLQTLQKEAKEENND